MTIDEAANILNVKKAKLGEESELQQMLKVSYSLFPLQSSKFPFGWRFRRALELNPLFLDSGARLCRISTICSQQMHQQQQRANRILPSTSNQKSCEQKNG